MNYTKYTAALGLLTVFGMTGNAQEKTAAKMEVAQVGDGEDGMILGGQAGYEGLAVAF